MKKEAKSWIMKTSDSKIPGAVSPVTSSYPIWKSQKEQKKEMRTAHGAPMTIALLISS